jgi:hypothetical protein
MWCYSISHDHDLVDPGSPRCDIGPLESLEPRRSGMSELACDGTSGLTFGIRAEEVI